MEVEVRPSESQEKVLVAVNNVFTYEEFQVKEQAGMRVMTLYSSTLRSLEKVWRLLREERILDASRKHLLRDMGDETLRFRLNKQVAYRGIVVFVDHPSESPLGPISFTVYHRPPREVVDWLAPRTSKGRPLWERETPKD